MPHKVTIYHKETGPAELYTIDARDALKRCPNEWSDKPWPSHDGKGDKAPASTSERKQSGQ